MKKVYVLLTVIMMFLLTACGSTSGDSVLSGADLYSNSDLSSSTTTSSEKPTDSTQSSPDDLSAAESGQSEQLSSLDTIDNTPLESGGKILIAYFSRWGNTNYPDDVDASTSASIVIDNGRFGTTEYIARMIQETVGGDIHLIETVTPYTTDFDELRNVNHDEMADNFFSRAERKRS